MLQPSFQKQKLKPYFLKKIVTTAKPIIDKVVDFITSTLKSVLDTDKETTQSPKEEEITTKMPELMDEPKMTPDIEAEITTMQMVLDETSADVTTMAPESVSIDTRPIMPRLDDEIPMLPKEETAETTSPVMVKMDEVLITTESTPTTVQPLEKDDSVQDTTFKAEQIDEIDTITTTVEPRQEAVSEKVTLKPVLDEETTIKSIKDATNIPEVDLEDKLFETTTVSTVSRIQTLL
jgi:hypothetical protein